MPGAETRVHLCGTLRVRWLGEPREDAFRRRQSLLLFAFLVLNRHRPVRRDELVGAVWPEEGAPARADELLAPLLSRLRKALGAEWLEGRQELTLKLPEGAVVDWEEMRAALDEARRNGTAGDWRAALAAARRALAIADGGLLPGVEAAWVEERRAELTEMRVEGLELAAQAGTALGGDELDEAVVAARAAVDAAPFRESCWARLIEALRAQGDATEALRAFDELRDLLAEELGAEPSWEVAALREALLREADGGGPPAAPAPSAPVAPPSGPGLVERERELGALDALHSALGLGEGRAAVIEGPAGLGKTRLLVETRRRAAAAGARVLTARASELERDFPFGVVRQLLEVELAAPDRGPRLLAGAAAPAAAVFATPDAASEEATASFAVLHGLYWAIVHLSADRPLVLAVDDLHWVDGPSLRLLAYLVRRLEGLPVLLLATLRSGEQAADPGLLDEIVHDPSTVSVRPGPLSPEAVAEVVRDRFGPQATDAFCAACHDTTGGNPLLLSQLLAALESEHVDPIDEQADRVHEIGPRAISRTIGLRLARMSDEAIRVGRAVAVLGDAADLTAVAELARLDVPEAGRAFADLARAEILRDEPPLGFVHPLVRDAVYYGVPVGERELQHARAARALAATGAPEDAVAVQLVKAPPAADPAAAATLRAAGRAAARKGAPDSAATFLRRALAEPPPAEERADLLLELGLTEQLVDGAAAAEHLRAAHAALTDPATRGTAALALGEILFFAAPPDETLGFLRRARAETPEELADLRLALEAYETMTLVRGGVADSDLDERLNRYERDGLPDDEGVGARMLESIVAWAWVLQSRDAQRSAELALRSLRGGALAEVDNGLLIPGPILALGAADRAEALAQWDAVLDEAYRRGSLLLTSTAHIWRGYELLRRGELGEAERSLRESLNELALWGSGGVVAVFPLSMLAGTLVEQGDLDGAEAIVRGGVQGPEGSQAHFFMLDAEVELALQRGDAARALAVAERLVTLTGGRANPAWVPAHDLLARALAANDRHEEARAAAATFLERAEAWGAPATLGRALRLVGELNDDVETLQRAVTVLAPSRARLERAKTLAELGRRLSGEAAAETLAAARDLAEVCGARTLADECAEVLEATGATPRAAAAGLSSLTSLERRVADLAEAGSDAREIAERLHLTPAEATAYLAAARRKLAA